MAREPRWMSVGVLLALALAGCGKPATPAPPAKMQATPPAAPADPADTVAAKAFLDGLYAHYRTSKDNTFQMFDADAAQVFDPDMLALLKADAAVLKDEVGVLDGDWLCDCQDFASIKADVQVRWATPTRAAATAAIADAGAPVQGVQHNLFDLDKVGGAWRIHDIQQVGQPSLRQLLSNEIKNGPG